jgi:hypothetical protein
MSRRRSENHSLSHSGAGTNESGICCKPLTGVWVTAPSHCGGETLTSVACGTRLGTKNTEHAKEAGKGGVLLAPNDLPAIVV